MSWTASRDPKIVGEVPAQLSGHDTRTLIEEIACSIAEAQAALFAGRLQDLETSIRHQQELCAALKALRDKDSSSQNQDNDPRDLVAAARRVRQQNVLFGAVARRMHRHLNTLRNLLNGLSLTYEPKPVKVPGREN